MIGDKVYNDKGEHISSIEDIIKIGITTVKIEYVVIKFGDFLSINEKLFAIPSGLLAVDQVSKAFILYERRKSLKESPGFDMRHWPETGFHAEETYWSFM